MTEETAFVDLAQSSFPFHVELLDAKTRTVVWETTVEGPGAMYVPGKSETNNGKPVDVRLTFPDGDVVEM